MQTEAKNIEVGKSIRFGWDSIKKEFWYFVGIAFLVIILQGIFNSDKDHPSRGLLGFIVSAWLTPGYIKTLLSYYDGKKLPIVEIFKQYKYFWRVLGANILLILIIVGGLVLFVIPGIYLALKYSFTIYFIVDQDLGIIDAMNKSAELTKSVKLSLLGFWLTCLGVVLLGALCFGVGVFVAIPIVWLAGVYIYRRLLK